jgi:nucleotidyltransferase substrate binding protein (TIGR01987 family)
MAEPFYQNFKIALKKLSEFCAQYDGSEIQTAGIIQAFEFTYEQCWKALQKKAGSEGVSIVSPKKAFEWAFQNGWITPEQEPQWLQMIADRNLTSHTYREAMALQVGQKVISTYLDLFKFMLDQMSR